MKKNIEPEYKSTTNNKTSTVLHQRKRSEASLSDEYETPKELLNYLQVTYDFYYLLDVASTKENFKGIERLTDGLVEDWILNSNPLYTDVWCNPPHSKNEQFVRKAFEQWQKHNINIMMLLPCNTQSSKYWHECIEGVAEYHPIKGRIRFLVDGKPSKHLSRNAYCVVIWRKK
ncbi:DNA adenine methyltransferase [Nitrososphaeria virus YSH_922147]|uniref:DNA adenine methyltransferase n=1 Tax=Nitrososphaeria virus YSH_922147 TaxID=3071323 RepID=A0A976UBL5_9CAUD|nr:DNA adenine methyltransferase [Yangshan Harbor Nitrososphaeria virus]UVF62466.1 DNA adenine methyltransferase [Nitrososphaeria virus YSH_922147]